MQNNRNEPKTVMRNMRKTGGTDRQYGKRKRKNICHQILHATL